jgi:hypothetical protein
MSKCKINVDLLAAPIDQRLQQPLQKPPPAHHDGAACVGDYTCVAGGGACPVPVAPAPAGGTSSAGAATVSLAVAVVAAIALY